MIYLNLAFCELMQRIFKFYGDIQNTNLAPGKEPKIFNV